MGSTEGCIALCLRGVLAKWKVWEVVEESELRVEYGRKEQQRGLSRIYGGFVATPGCYRCTGWGEQETEGPKMSCEVDL